MISEYGVLNVGVRELTEISRVKVKESRRKRTIRELLKDVRRLRAALREDPFNGEIEILPCETHE